jgi:dGTPase
MENFSILAANPKYAKRIHPEKEHLFRSPFERDRDRILYSKEFRRLNRKTQVFVAGFDDHVRNRLTHTIEVAQISQTIASQFGLDQALTTAIAYGHDVGHTPFGHVGERTLNYLMNGCGDFRDFNEIHIDYRGFKHNWQSIRVLMDLEKISNNYDGLNLTNYTLWGVLNHTGKEPKICEYKSKLDKCFYKHANKDCKIIKDGLLLTFYEKYNRPIDPSRSWTFEGLIVHCADEIAQRHHDIEDGLLAGVINKDEMLAIITPLSEYFTNIEIDRLLYMPYEHNLNVFTSLASSLLINLLVSNLIQQTSINLESLITKYQITDNDSFYKQRDTIFLLEDINKIFTYSDDLIPKEAEMQTLLKNRILNSQIAQSMDGKSTFILSKIIKVYLDNPQQLPDSTIFSFYNRYLSKSAKKKLIENTYEENIGLLRERLKTDHSKKNTFRYRNILMRTICDFIAGMTDDFALKQYDKLYSSENVFIHY